MKKYLSLTLIMIAFMAQPVWAKNHAQTVAEKVNKENIFNKVTDYLATVGKSDVSKFAIKNQRHEERRRNRLKTLNRKKELAEENRLENER